MKVYPAIDLLQGNAVRMRKGNRDESKVYSKDPASLVAGFVDAGAERLHVVDLEGAFTGTRANRGLIIEIVKNSPIPVQVGGGIRDRATLDEVFEMGAQFAVLGTAAVKDRRFVKKACRAYPERIIVAVDSGPNGQVHIQGWAEKSEMTTLEVATRAVLWGAAGLLYTIIDRDGTKSGADVQAIAALANTVDIPVIGRGGIDSLKNLGELAAREVPAVIIGAALYDGDFTLEEAIRAAGEASA